MARVPYTEQEDLDPEHRDLIVSTLQPGKRVNVYSAIGNNQAVLAGLRSFVGSLWSDSGVTDRQREIVILSVAAAVGAAYEWHQHVNIGTDVGLTEDEIAAIGRDDREPFSREEGVLIAYARAVAHEQVRDELHEAMAAHFDDDTIVGVSCTAAGYLGLNRVIDALGVDLEERDSFVGWDPTTE